MAKNSDDRRARRSRRLLKESLLVLMKRKAFSQISVRDVTDEADMNRGTFYLHYTGTVELLQSLEADLLQELEALIDAHLQETVDRGSVRPLLEPLLDFVVERQETWAVLLDEDDASGISQGLQRLIRKKGAGVVETWFHPQNSQLGDYLLTFLAWGFIGLLKEWFAQDMALPQEELIAAAQRLADGATAGLFPRA
ncbi:MAG: TetR family transcriptional regulator [Ruminiclostridium sp.]|jgi:AcrR family transcriptional regulator|nr:TetR family transcriptional regulator [Ruminiclostridium sp.]MCI9465875.1 TetR family transcriptional regulator [Ruminiclostridium sp.]